MKTLYFGLSFNLDNTLKLSVDLCFRTYTDVGTLGQLNQNLGAALRYMHCNKALSVIPMHMQIQNYHPVLSHGPDTYTSFKICAV